MRIQNTKTLHTEEKPGCPLHEWRVVECCGPNSGPDRDIVECSKCGRQETQYCNFDEDYD